MATQDKLEIIRRNGEIEFYTLDPGGITNIGRHPENDIVLTSPGIAPFHAVIEHRQKPYHIVVLSHNGQTTLGGQILSPNVSTPLGNWDSLEIDGHTLILMEGTGTGVTVSAPVQSQAQPGRSLTPTAPHPAAPAPPVVPPPTRPEEPVITSSLGPPRFLTTSPGDLADDTILTEFETRERTIEAAQSAVYSITIINGGPIVATFVVNVVGLDLEWVTVSPTYVNLYEGERTSVTVTVTPPRLPTSLAGSHPFAIIVTSPNYPRRYSQREAILTINPYYEFAVGELDPKQQTISWFHRFGEARVTINNKGNSSTYFRLEGTNDERACSFEFQVPGETVGLAQQAELRLMPEEQVSIPVRITPYSRRLFGLRKRTYAYTITTTAIASQQTPRSLLGHLKTKPLLGPFPLALMLLLLLLLIMYIFWPTVYTFNGDPKMIRAGEEVKLRWRASTFTNVRIDNGVGPLEGTAGEVIVAPKNTTTYRLNGDNWLSALSPNWFGVFKEVTIEVEPVKPIIRVFSADKDSLLTGEELTLAWEVVDADELVLKTNGNPETILSTEHTSERITKPSVDTTYVLEAHNIYGEVTDSLEVKVLIPTPTLVPTPFVRKFIANPSVITVGTPVVVEWDVEGADVVSVQPVGGNLPPIQSVSQSPQQNTTYVLNAAKGSSSIQPIAIQVYVTPAPTATPVPDAPEIVFFEADPAELIQGKATPTDDEKAVNLKWLVRGTVTNVELNGGPDIGVFSNLDPEGTLPVSLSKDTVFVLTAFNQDKTSSKTVQVQVLEATPTPVPPTPPPTPLPLPKILNFAITSPGSPQVIKVSSTEYQVQVNTAVTFEWQADAAATGGTELSLAGQVIGSGSNNGIAKDIKITASGSYVVVAKNAEGKASSPAVINVTVIDQLPPNPPYNLTATEDQTNKSVKLDWKWDNDPSRSPATGYRVYRADVGGSFSQIAEISGASTKTFTDTNVAPNTCNKIYYVVAIYVDLQGNMKESAVSANSWYTSPGPCP